MRAYKEFRVLSHNAVLDEWGNSTGGKKRDIEKFDFHKELNVAKYGVTTDNHKLNFSATEKLQLNSRRFSSVYFLRKIPVLKRKPLITIRELQYDLHIIH